VRWEDVVRRLLAEGVTTFVELGPGKVLSGLNRQIDRSVTSLNVGDEATLEKTLTTVKGSA
jgi:[acyl-carrier-protein] S-malonyltransferase